ncbi:thiol:disulfide interchange protein, partial [Pseudomonas aeruginosa]
LLLVTVGSRFLPKPGPWMNLVKGVFGFLFLGTAWILLRPLLGEALWIGLGGALLLVLAYAALHTVLLLVTVGSRFLPKPGPWMNLVKGVFGFLFLGT